MLRPNWPAPANIVAYSTTRQGLLTFTGLSQAPYDSFNLGDHVDDQAAAVAANRCELVNHCDDLSAIAWLDQVHGTEVVSAQLTLDYPLRGDASITSEVGLACGVLTADCLPVLFCRRDGRQVAAAHAGWRGLRAGMLAETVSAFDCAPSGLLAWIGPAISQPHFEVGAEVREAFLAGFPNLAFEDIRQHFVAVSEKPGHFLADLPGLACAQLEALGVGWVGNSGRCSYAENQHFYSYRRQRVTGRQLSFIYIQQ